MNPPPEPRRWVSLGEIIGAPPPLHCKRDESFRAAPATPFKAGTPEDEAAERTARDAGYIPLEPPPADRHAGW
ncbi:hypothetical protein G3I76_72345, partial [Streptomyces sp. SID11233]|nr:hypothetical protein [Streptomyces sp. SID11233]